MTDQEKIQAANRVQRLIEGGDLDWLIEYLRERHVARFVNSGVGESDKREEAHAMLRCLSEVKTQMKALEDQGKRVRRNQDEQERV